MLCENFKEKTENSIHKWMNKNSLLLKILLGPLGIKVNRRRQVNAKTSFEIIVNCEVYKLVFWKVFSFSSSSYINHLFNLKNDLDRMIH